MMVSHKNMKNTDKTERGETLVFTDRYQALGMDYPDPKTMCGGQCEGTGWVPVAKDDTEEPWRSLWAAAHAKPHEEPCDGWHFVKCPDCGGTGKVHVAQD